MHVPARPKGVQGIANDVLRDLTALGVAPRTVAPDGALRSFLQCTRRAVPPATLPPRWPVGRIHQTASSASSED